MSLGHAIRRTAGGAWRALAEYVISISYLLLFGYCCQSNNDDGDDRNVSQQKLYKTQERAREKRQRLIPQAARVMARQNLNLSTSGSYSSLADGSDDEATAAGATGEETGSGSRTERRKTEGVLNYVASIFRSRSSFLMSQNGTSGEEERRHSLAPETGTGGRSDAVRVGAMEVAVDTHEPRESSSDDDYANSGSGSGSNESSSDENSDSDGTASVNQSNEDGGSNGPGASEELVNNSVNDNNKDSVDDAGTANATTDVTLLLAFSQGAISDMHSQMLTEEGTEQGVVAQSTLADVVVLEHMSQQIIDAVSEMAQQLDTATVSVTTDALQRLDGLAREQVLARRQHFGRRQFVENAQRPLDATDMVQWAMALQRANLATFALLVFRPQVALIESVARGVPNRERLLSSLGFADAAREFFKHVVPASRRDDSAIGLLVDMQTQQWLMAASSEAHLQSMVTEERDADNAIVRELLALDRTAQEDPDSAPSFDSTAPDLYRVELSRRLDRLSGGRLEDTRAQYPLRFVWRRVAQFVAECAAALTVPTLMDSALAALQGDESIGSEAAAYEGEEGDAAADGPDAASDTSMISGDFEITVFKERGLVDRTRAAPATLRESPLLDAEGGAEEDLAAPADDVTPIDPSFQEVRRVAAVMRDVLPDPHLESLLQDITAERIDIGEPSAQTRTPRRMREPRRQVIPASADDKEDFQLRFDDQHSDASEAVDAMPEAEADMETQGSSGHSRNRRSLRRGRSQNMARAGSEPLDSAAEELAHQFVNMLKGPAKLIHYNRQAKTAQPGSDEFRGRRGIAAEDLSVLQEAGANERVAFTPSIAGSPAPEDSASDVENNAKAAERRSLGQYKPLAMRPSSAHLDWEHQQHETDVGRTRTKRKHVDASPARRGKMRKSSAMRRPHSRWTAEEEDCFIHAVFQHGLRWARILYHHGPNGVDDHVLKNRTRFNLKDKARNIKLRLLREKKPLGPFASATGHL
ncbi:TTAGGG repeat binding factor [Coemansia sp. RSA 988]|nr:TTAGGG repeat binding factor [Coemansia sp. RSA 988]